MNATNFSHEAANTNKCGNHLVAASFISCAHVCGMSLHIGCLFIGDVIQKCLHQLFNVTVVQETCFTDSLYSNMESVSQWVIWRAQQIVFGVFEVLLGLCTCTQQCPTDQKHQTVESDYSNILHRPAIKINK